MSFEFMYIEAAEMSPIRLLAHVCMARRTHALIPIGQILRSMYLKVSSPLGHMLPWLVVDFMGSFGIVARDHRSYFLVRVGRTLVGPQTAARTMSVVDASITAMATTIVYEFVLHVA